MMKEDSKVQVEVVLLGVVVLAVVVVLVLVMELAWEHM